jgi:hypothetical protein
MEPRETSGEPTYASNGNETNDEDNVVRTPTGKNFRWSMAVSHENSRREEVASMVDDGERVHIDEDVYGAAVFSITFDFFEMLSGKDHDGLGIALNIYRCIFVSILLLSNYALQIGMLCWVYSYVAMPSVHEAQHTYRKFHAIIFSRTSDGGTELDLDRWDDWDQDSIDSLCNLAFANFWFMYAILCLWWILMLTEVRKTERLWRKIRQLKDAECPDAMIVKLDEDDGSCTNLVVGLTMVTRTTLYLALLLPKLFIAICLTAVGTMWLTASTGFSELILNSVALEFIICIDEILFQGLLPESIKQNISVTQLVMPAEKTTGDPAKDAAAREKKITEGYHRSTWYCVTIVVGVYLFMTYGQYLPILGVYPGYANDAACPIWWGKKTAEVCSPGEECFPIIAH